VKISHGQLTMQRLGLGGRLVGWSVQSVIETALHDAWQRKPGESKKYDHENQQAEAFHRHSEESIFLSA
jgi:hypothetical protein